MLVLNGPTVKWKPLIYKGIDLSNKFLVSNQGQIYSLKSRRVLKTYINKKGYKQVCVSLGNQYKKLVIKPHMAVAFMFVSGYKEGLQVNHKDGDKLNCCTDNLEWVTPQQNMRHAFDNGLASPMNKQPVDMIKDGKVIKNFESIADAQRYLNKPENHGNIRRAIETNGTAYGYKWRFGKCRA